MTYANKLELWAKRQPDWWRPVRVTRDKSSGFEAWQSTTAQTAARKLHRFGVLDRRNTGLPNDAFQYRHKHFAGAK